MNKPDTIPPIKIIGVINAGKDCHTSFNVSFGATFSHLGKIFFLEYIFTTTIIARPRRIPGTKPDINNAPVLTLAIPA